MGYTIAMIVLRNIAKMPSLIRDAQLTIMTLRNFLRQIQELSFCHSRVTSRRYSRDQTNNAARQQ